MGSPNAWPVQKTDATTPSQYVELSKRLIEQLRLESDRREAAEARLSAANAATAKAAAEKRALKKSNKAVLASKRALKSKHDALKTKYSKLLAVVQNEVRRRGELAEEDAQQPGREMSAATPALPIGCESQPPGAAQQQAADPMLPEASGDAGGEGVRQTTSATRGHAPQPDAPSASPGVPPPTTDKPRAPQPSRARRHRATLPTLDCAECAKFNAAAGIGRGGCSCRPRGAKLAAQSQEEFWRVGFTEDYSAAATSSLIGKTFRRRR